MPVFFQKSSTVLRRTVNIGLFFFLGILSESQSKPVPIWKLGKFSLSLHALPSFLPSSLKPSISISTSSPTYFLSNPKYSISTCGSPTYFWSTLGTILHQQESNLIYVLPPPLFRMVSCGRDNIRLWRVKDGALRSAPVTLGEYHMMEFTDCCFETGYEATKDPLDRLV